MNKIHWPFAHSKQKSQVAHSIQKPQEMKSLKSFELQAIINTCYEAVDKSNLGPMFIINEDGKIQTDEHNAPMFKALPYNTFLQIINLVIAQAIFPDTISLFPHIKK